MARPTFSPRQIATDAAVSRELAGVQEDLRRATSTRSSGITRPTSLRYAVRSSDTSIAIDPAPGVALLLPAERAARELLLFLTRNGSCVLSGARGQIVFAGTPVDVVTLTVQGAYRLATDGRRWYL